MASSLANDLLKIKLTKEEEEIKGDEQPYEMAHDSTCIWVKLRASPIEKKHQGSEEEWRNEGKKLIKLGEGETTLQVKKCLACEDGYLQKADLKLIEGEATDATEDMVLNGKGGEVKRNIFDMSGRKVGERKMKRGLAHPRQMLVFSNLVNRKENDMLEL
ncbi:hypothetical protein Cgig2_023542 [Carnegiea gigantea]|uniref:Uncharacterized protein n=1 Tax=Carnegiea gigantea TaxID=171969 RepID=A0A9Q1JTQ2_9CARY|nr:hypothetical protein Cgig2_023542 [Carnegiea gigantea]